MAPSPATSNTVAVAPTTGSTGDATTTVQLTGGGSSSLSTLLTQDTGSAPSSTTTTGLTTSNQSSSSSGGAHSKPHDSQGSPSSSASSSGPNGPSSTQTQNKGLSTGLAVAIGFSASAICALAIVSIYVWRKKRLERRRSGPNRFTRPENHPVMRQIGPLPAHYGQGPVTPPLIRGGPATFAEKFGRTSDEAVDDRDYAEPAPGKTIRWAEPSVLLPDVPQQQPDATATHSLDPSSLPTMESYASGKQLLPLHQDHQRSEVTSMVSNYSTASPPQLEAPATDRDDGVSLPSMIIAGSTRASIPAEAMPSRPPTSHISRALSHATGTTSWYSDSSLGRKSGAATEITHNKTMSSVNPFFYDLM